MTLNILSPKQSKRPVAIKLAVSIAFILSMCSQAFATWSIIIVDPKTKEIGIAGASCTYNCYGIGRIIPDKGAIIVQAMSNREAREKGTQMILADAPPEEIIQAMRDSIFDPERQQYAVITITFIDRPETYTGQLTNAFKGALTDYGVSVQGNTLASETELHVVLDAVRKGRTNSLHITDILMLALDAGAIAGGDKRCGDQKATSAFVMVARPGDKKPYLQLVIFGQGKGRQNAVELLKLKYERWKRKHPIK
jgi:uncharacterized Ntn-hydrolase superfamily protein